MNFGLGKPVFVGPDGGLYEGDSVMFADPQNEGGALLAITLHQKHMKQFLKLLYTTIHASCLKFND